MRLRMLFCHALLLFAWNPAHAAITEMEGKPVRIQNGNLGNINLIVGFRGGVNFAQPFVMDHNEVFQTDNSSVLYEKEYSPLFVNIGYHYAFLFMVYLKESLSLSFEPAISNYNYKYQSNTGWTNGADPTDYIEYAAHHKNTISYLEFPLIMRMEFGNGTIKPFVSLGLVYGYRLNATKKMEYTVTRYNGSSPIPYENSTVYSDNSDSYIHSRLAVAPGIGFFYPVGAVKIMLSADFAFGLNNIIDESQRFANSAVTSGMYDVQDDMRLSALNITLGILFNTGRNQAGKAVECVTFKRKR